MRRFPVILVALIALGLGTATASADAPQTVAPTAKQKAAILKAWNNGKAVPANKQQCLSVALSKSNKVWAALKFNDKATGCMAMAFDGTAILWGSGASWNIFMEGSSVDPATCTAMQGALGADAWVDLVDYAGGMGCQNID